MSTECGDEERRWTLQSRRWLLTVLGVLALGWAGLIVAVPHAAGQHRLGGWPGAVVAATYLAGGYVCHQQSARSFHLAGAQLPVCARCAGLYAAAPWGVLWVVAGGSRVPRRQALMGSRASAVRVARAALFVAALPTLVTWASEQLGFVYPSNAVRAVAAVPLGLTAAWVLALALLGALDEEPGHGLIGRA